MLTRIIRVEADVKRSMATPKTVEEASRNVLCKSLALARTAQPQKPRQLAG